jgi:hypothetical protein
MDALKYFSENKLAGYYVQDTKDGRGRLPRSTIVVDHHEGSLGLSLGLEPGQGLTAKQFLGLLNGKWDGQQLVKTRTNRGADLIFSVPKSVSEAAVAAEATGDSQRRQRLDNAILEAANWTIRNHVDQQAPFGRRSAPGGKRSPGMQGTPTEAFAGEILGMPFLQRAARPNTGTQKRGAPPDIHLHVHYLVAPIVRDPDSGKFYTLDTGKVFRRKWFERMDQAFQYRLAENLRNLDYGIEACDWSDAHDGRVSWELQGSSPEARRHWSSNHERLVQLRREVEDATGRPATDKVLNKILYDTRLPKDAAAKKADSLNPVWQAWVADAERAGVPIGEFTSRGQAVDVGLARIQVWERLYSPAGLTRDGALFEDDSILPTLLRCANGLGLGEGDIDEMHQEIRQEVVEIPTPEGTRFTTARELAEERFIEATAADKAAEVRPTPPNGVTKATIAALPFTLDDRQTEAVKAFCGPSAWVHVTGDAGTGKTTMTSTAVEIMRTAGLVDEVVVVSTAAKAARDTAKKINADHGWSVDACERAIEFGTIRPTKRTLVIIEEAGMFSNNGIARTLKAIGPATVRFLGDDKQLEAIGPAGWYQDDLAKHGSVHLNEVRRHIDPADAQTYRQVRNGEAPAALATLKGQGRLHVSGTPEDSTVAITDKWRALRDEGLSADQIRITTDASNQKVDELNRWAQRDRRERGELTGEPLALRSRRGDREWVLYKGDSVLFLKPHGRGRNKVVNGSTATVMNIDARTRNVRLRLDDGRVTSVLMQTEAELQPIGLAYAQHANKMQGAEVKIALVAPGSPAVTNRFTAYSMLTRSTHETHVFADAETHGDQRSSPEERESSVEANLGEVWSEGTAKRTALSMMREATERPDLAQNAAVRTRERHYAAVVSDVAPEVDARSLMSAPAWPTLAKRLEQLHGQQLDAAAMISEAAASRELTTAHDPAATLVRRLDRTPSIPLMTPTTDLGHDTPTPTRPDLSRTSSTAARNGERRYAALASEVPTPETKLSLAERWKRFTKVQEHSPVEVAPEPLVQHPPTLAERWQRFRHPKLADRVRAAKPPPVVPELQQAQSRSQSRGIGLSRF